MEEIRNIFKEPKKIINLYEELDKNTTNSEYHGKYSNYDVKTMITEFHERIIYLEYIEEHKKEYLEFDKIEEIFQIKELRKQILTKLNYIQAKNFNIKQDQINYNIANQEFINYIK